jgi:aryl-alcohol dehydrogenase-like predicted oxidoreductase
LKTDYIDLYWLHIWDKMTPVEEVMRAFDDLVRQGKVLYIGVSDAPAWWIAQANTIADLRGWTKFVGLQIEYSLVERTVERELIPMAKAFNLGPDRIVFALKKISEETGRSQAQVALAWLRYRDVPVIPILGVRRISQLQDNLDSLTLELSGKHLADLDEASAIELGFPHDFYKIEMVKSLIYGGMQDRILDAA